jgi:glutamate carboxypeptidase
MELATLEHWVNINSGSHNPDGLRLMADALQEHLAELPGKLERIPLKAQKELDGSRVQPGEALRLRFNPDAPVRVLFSGHMDTVYDAGHVFQRLRYLDAHRATGPGIADMKGGLFIMISAVERFLKKHPQGHLGGEILITADEEIGSPGSRELLFEAADWNHLGLVFESALPGGELVCRRKGTGTYRITARGKSAHTGRDFAAGRNAIVGLSALMVDCHKLNDTYPDAIVNVGRFSGGGPVNVVPDRAEAWLNLRIGKRETLPEIQSALGNLVRRAGEQWEGVSFKLEGEFARPPKEESSDDAALHELWNEAETALGMPLSGKRETGGSSDGNVFSEAGLPHLDGVGIRGGAIHSPDEFALLDSIPGQIDKVVAFLEAIAAEPGRFIKPPFTKSL